MYREIEFKTISDIDLLKELFARLLDHKNIFIKKDGDEIKKVVIWD